MGGRDSHVSRGKTVGLTVTYFDGSTGHFRATKDGRTISLGGAGLTGSGVHEVPRTLNEIASAARTQGLKVTRHNQRSLDLMDGAQNEMRKKLIMNLISFGFEVLELLEKVGKDINTVKDYER